MKLKKLVTLLVVLSSVFSLVACSSNEPKPQVPESDPVVEPTSDPEPEVKLPEVMVPASAIEFLDFSFTVNGNEVKYADLNGIEVVKVKIDYLLDKNGNPATDKETGEPLVVSYTGYRLVDVLKAIGVDYTGKSVYAVCSDGFESDPYEFNDLAEYLIIGVEKDKEQASDGTLYFAPVFEQTNGKYARAVVGFVVE